MSAIVFKVSLGELKQFFHHGNPEFLPLAYE
jgi:hypothetical protein